MPSLRALSLATALLPALAHALDFTTPTTTDLITRGADLTTTWTTVDTDPAVFSLYLWNFVNWPPYYEPLAYGIDTASGSATVRIPCHIATGAGWQLTAINDTNVYVLYAQTGTFNVTGEACTDPESPLSTACYAPASTVYVTQTAATGSATVATTVASSTVTAAVIQPGVVDGSTTSQPTVSTTTATATATLAADAGTAL